MTQETAAGTPVTATDKKRVPPYIPFMTFTNLITWLETEDVPVKFDRSFWGKKYGGTMGIMLMAGMRFLGLLSDDYTQPLLRKIVDTKGDERKGLLADMIRQSYTEIDFSQLSGGTPNMLKDWFSRYNIDGSTDRKARSFFVNACKAYGVPISRTLMKTARNKAPGGSQAKKTEGESKPPQQSVKTSPNIKSPATPIPPGQQQQQDMYVLVLSDGCELRLCAGKGFFDMEKIDRAIVESIVDKMKEHRK